MTTTYKFKAGYTKAGVEAAPSSPPTITIVDYDDNVLVNAAACTALVNLVGVYVYNYSGADGLDLVGLFHTTDATVDQQDLYSQPVVYLPAGNPVPYTATAPALLGYINANFPQIKTQLGWSDSDQLATISNKTLEIYGVATEALATDARKLHALADLAVWRQALNDISLDYAFAADNASYSRNQATDAVRANLMEAETKAMAYLPSYKMTVHPDAANPDWTA